MSGWLSLILAMVLLDFKKCRLYRFIHGLHQFSMVLNELSIFIRCFDGFHPFIDFSMALSLGFL